MMATDVYNEYEIAEIILETVLRHISVDRKRPRKNSRVLSE